MQIPTSAVSQAALLFKADPQGLTLLGGMDGLAYEFSLQGNHFVLKIAPFPASDPQKPAQMAEKFAFVHYLAQNGVRVAASVASISGKWVEEVVDGKSRYTASAAAKAGGEHIGDRNPGSLTPEIFRKWGQVTGQIHRLSKQYPKWCCDDALPTLIGDWRKGHQSFANWGGSPDKAQDKNTFLEGFLRSFLQGYRYETSLDPIWITQLPLFLKHHQILLYIVFTDEWRNAPNKWQTHTLTSLHRSILEDRPVIDLDLKKLAHELN